MNTQCHSAAARMALALTLIGISLFSSAGSQGVGARPPTATKLISIGERADAYLTGLVKRQQFSGSVLIARHGTILFSKGYGLADVAHHVPNTPQTQFRLAHVTKQFTALAILLLQERGKLHVRDHICRYIAGCPPLWRPITIQQCLNQTSGLHDVDPTAETATTPDALVTSFKQQPLRFTPPVRSSASAMLDISS